MLPSNAPPADALHLWIVQLSCRCGNRWTHSVSWLADKASGPRGGTPNPQQAEKLPYLSYEAESHRQVNGCFRCVPLALGIGWTKPWVSTAPAKPKPSVLSAVDNLLKE